MARQHISRLALATCVISLSAACTIIHEAPAGDRGTTGTGGSSTEAGGSAASPVAGSGGTSAGSPGAGSGGVDAGPAFDGGESDTGLQMDGGKDPAKGFDDPDAWSVGPPPLLELGEECDADSDCAGHPAGVVTCTRSEQPAPRRCRLNRPAGEGEPCARSSEKQSRVLAIKDTDLEFGVCQLTDHLVCVDFECLAVALPGEACSSELPCHDHTMHCDGTCFLDTPIGAACVQGEVNPCEGGAYCDGERCQEKKHGFASCESGEECRSKECSDGRCTVPPLTLHKVVPPGQSVLGH
ncbi:MAG: hypothetical protein KC766_03335 [Myxococcales bacterium]|nr:hypothetical protein [Myxococcales bacterium]